MVLAYSSKDSRDILTPNNTEEIDLNRNNLIGLLH